MKLTVQSSALLIMGLTDHNDLLLNDSNTRVTVIAALIPPLNHKHLCNIQCVNKCRCKIALSTLYTGKIAPLLTILSFMVTVDCMHLRMGS